MGLPGSGKSYFAKHLSGSLNCDHISSDGTRKKMEAMGKYRWEDKMAVYRNMLQAAKTVLDQGRDLVLDATFFKEGIRNDFIDLAKERSIPYAIFWIEAPLEIIKERLSKKREDSEADFFVYAKLEKDFETPRPPFLKLSSTQNNIEEMLDKAQDYLKKLL